MICEMCGKEASLVRARIEGAEVNVCTNCAKFGTVLKNVMVGKPKESSTPKIISQQKETVEDVVEDYAEIVKKAREKTGLTQEEFGNKINEKEGLIHKIETGKLMPNIKLARKLESYLHIKLVEIIEERHNITSEKPKSNELTLGDIIKIKKKD